jgi:hemerythrin-like metal-binding protein
MTIQTEAKRVSAYEGLAFNSLRQLINWDPSLKIGNAEIDDQHEHIFSLAVKASELARDHSMAPELLRVFDELGKLLTSHFRLEEEKMAQFSSSEKQQHLAQHEAILKEFEFIRNRLVNNGVGWAYEEQALVVLNFMIGVTVGHVLQSDARLA